MLGIYRQGQNSSFLYFISTGECIHGTIRLMAGDDDYELYMGEEVPNTNFIKDTLSQGRVEICIRGTFGTICAEDWSNEDASVVCREQGFSTFGKFSNIQTGSAL